MQFPFINKILGIVVPKTLWKNQMHITVDWWIDVDSQTKAFYARVGQICQKLKTLVAYRLEEENWHADKKNAFIKKSEIFTQ